MVPDTRAFVTDFRRLKVTLPFTAHLKGVVVGEKRERLTNNGAEQISFTIMDRQHRSVPCIAHNVSASPDMFTEGTELLLFYAVGTEGLKKSPGSVWIYADSYVFSTGSIFLPGAPIEEIRLMP